MVQTSYVISNPFATGEILLFLFMIQKSMSEWLLKEKTCFTQIVPRENENFPHLGAPVSCEGTIPKYLL